MDQLRLVCRLVMTQPMWQNQMPNLTQRVREIAPGLLLTLTFAVASFATWWFLQGTWIKVSALLWAFIYSIIAVNVLPRLSGSKFAAGIEFSSSRLLRLAIALLGLTISASVWIELGGVGVAVVLINLAFAFLLGSFFCRYVLKMDGGLSILLGVGTSICGASAIAATGPAIRAKSEEMACALAVITLFGSLAMFGYPFLFEGPIGTWLENNHFAYGMWTGMGIHETAQVIGAASQVSEAVGVAMSAKSVRIFMIGPMVFVSQLLYRRFTPRDTVGHVNKLSIPWFIIAFVLFTFVHAGLRSLPIAEGWVSFNTSYIKPAVTFLLAWAFAAVGFKVKLSAIRCTGVKGFLGGMIVAIAAGATALLLTKYIWLPFGM